MNAETIAKGLQKARKCSAGYVACCPAHEDHEPSLSLTDAGDKVLVHCHAGCDQAAVVAALKDLGLWPSGTIFQNPAERTVTERAGEIHQIASGTLSPIESVYTYTDAEGEPLYQVVRKTGKKFLQRYSDGAGGWIWKKHPGQVLYRLREVLENTIVFVVEGEKDVETLRSHGFTATTNAGGASAAWLPELTAALSHCEVILIPDRDAAGYARVKRIARALVGKVAKLTYLDLEDGKDVSEWFTRGHSELELIAQLESEEVAR